MHLDNSSILRKSDDTNPPFFIDEEQSGAYECWRPCLEMLKNGFSSGRK